MKFATKLLTILLCASIAWTQPNHSKPQELPYETDELVDVGGFRLHLNCSGTQTGAPTVVLDAGLNRAGYDWILVQREVSKFARVCSYDRAGHGLSEIGPKPRTSRTIAQELHTLLHAAQIPGPYLLVGHSIGGINIRTYTALYPQDVMGLVLVDASHEDQIERFAQVVWPTLPLANRLWDGFVQFLHNNFAFIRRANSRKSMRESPKPPLFSDEQWGYYLDLQMSSKTWIPLRKKAI